MTEQPIIVTGCQRSGTTITAHILGNAKQYIGTMSDEVKKIFPEAVVKMANGYEGVRYDLTDVYFKEVI